MEIHSSALKHGMVPEDIEHAVRNSVAIDDLEDDLRLCLGPDRTGAVLEVISVVGDEDTAELVIHAMPMRDKYRRLLPGGPT
ncbi:MAG TPA: hypothetical protein VFA11_13890 [Acidimicrobiales bacterium]|nr:hypothetical protein [Acidimicrobiales bacterium]